MMIHYNSTSNHFVIDEGMNITSVLIADEYIESLLVINNDMIYNFHVDRMHLECFIANLSTAKKTVLHQVCVHNYDNIMPGIVVSTVLIHQLLPHLVGNE